MNDSVSARPNVNKSAIEPISSLDSTTPGVELTLTKSKETNSHDRKSALTPEQEERRQALQSMLATSNARYQQALRKRGPVFAAGINVKITTPSLFGQIAVVLDADYIESRALLSIPNQDEPLWLPFTELDLPD